MIDPVFDRDIKHSQSEILFLQWQFLWIAALRTHQNSLLKKEER